MKKIKTKHFKIIPAIGIGYWKDIYKPPFKGFTHNFIILCFRIQYGELYLENPKKKISKFEKDYLPKLEKYTNIVKRDNGSYTFTTNRGIVDYYPKGGKLLIRQENTWVNNGIEFIQTYLKTIT